MTAFRGKRFPGWQAAFVVLIAACGGAGSGPSRDAGNDGDTNILSDNDHEAEPGDGDADPGDFPGDSRPDGGDGADGSTDLQPPALVLSRVEPSSGGASVPSRVALAGSGFGPGLSVTVGGIPASDVRVLAPDTAQAIFPPVPLPERGKKDVRLALDGQESILPQAFEYLFDEDPVVFVHGYMVSSSEWNTMLQRFRDAGYPAEALFAIDFRSSLDSHLTHARDELPPYVASALQQTGAARVDIVAHSAGGMAARLWIKLYGGQEAVRDFISLSGTHHGTELACLGGWTGDAAREQCPVYARESESVNGVQWILNGDPDTADVDETPFGVEEGGNVYYHALWTEDDRIDVPPHTCCLNQAFRGDCSDPVNVKFSGISHMDMVTDQTVFELTLRLVRQHNPNKP